MANDRVGWKKLVIITIASTAFAVTLDYLGVFNKIVAVLPLCLLSIPPLVQR